MRKKQVDRRRGHLIEVKVDRGEGRRRQLGAHAVIAGDEAEVFRDTAPHRPRRVQNASCKGIDRHTQGRKGRFRAQKPFGSFRGSLLATPFIDADSNGRGAGTRRVGGFHLDVGIASLLPGDQADVTVHGKQMVEQKLRRRAALQIHEGNVLPARRATDAHDVHAAIGKEIEDRIVAFGLHNDRAVHFERIEAVTGPKRRHEARDMPRENAVTAAAAAISIRKPSREGPAATAKGMEETRAIEPARPVRRRWARWFGR